MNNHLLLATFLGCFVAAHSQSTHPVFHDNFDDDAITWSIHTTGDYIYFKFQGRYIMENFDNDYHWSGQRLPINDKANYTITCSTLHTKGVNTSGYGLLFGGKDDGNSYVFCISAGGSYCVFVNDAGRSAFIFPWTKSPLIKTGDNDENILKIERSPTSWSFYVNGGLLNTYGARPFYGDKIGLITFGNQRISFDDLWVYGEMGGGNYAVNNDDLIKKESINNSSASTLYTFEDDFSYKKEQWSWDQNPGKTGGKAYTVIENGVMVLQSYKDESARRSLTGWLTTDEEFTLSADYTRLSGDEGTSYCMNIEAADSKNGIAFYIAPTDGNFALMNFREGVNTGDWQYSPYIKQGNSTNTLLIKCDGANFNFYCNGNLLGSLPARSFEHPNIYLISKRNQLINCDNFKLNGHFHK